MKKYILFFVFICTSFAAKAQYNYYEWGIGGGASYMRGYDDLVRQDYHKGGFLGVTYNYSPYVPVTLDFEFGTIEGGGRTRLLDRYGRYSKNNFKALVFHADLQLGEIIDYEGNFFLNTVKNFYIGSGVGAIANKMADIQRTNLFPENGPTTGPDAGKGFEGQNSGVNILVPVRLGYEFKIFDSYQQVAYTITLGMQHNITWGEGLDGYNDPPVKFKNNAPDQFTQYSISFKYNFGNSVSYNKAIKNFRF